LTKVGREHIIEGGMCGKKRRLREDLITARLTITVEDVQKVEFLDNFAGLPACSGGQQRIGRPEARKEVILSG